MTSAQAPVPAIPSSLRRMLYDSMKHRTQLYLDEAQHRWLRQRAGSKGSIAAVVRQLIDAERARRPDPTADPLLRYLVDLVADPAPTLRRRVVGLEVGDDQDAHPGQAIPAGRGSGNPLLRGTLDGGGTELTQTRLVPCAVDSEHLAFNRERRLR